MVVGGRNHMIPSDRIKILTLLPSHLLHRKSWRVQSLYCIQYLVLTIQQGVILETLTPPGNGK